MPKLGYKQTEEHKEHSRLKRKGLHYNIGNKSFLGHKHSDNTKKIISKQSSERKMSNLTIKHHKYLKEFSKEVMKMTGSMHIKLHSNAYKYIMVKYGKEGIDNYLKWFNKEFNVKV